MANSDIKKKLRKLAEKKLGISQESANYAEGGLVGANTVASLKPILKEIYNSEPKKQALKTVRDRKSYKPRKPKVSIPKG